jgi:hypothetical protein
MKAKTPTERHAELVKRREESGLKLLRNLWAHPEDHPKIKTTVAAMNAKRGIVKKGKK